MSPGLRVTILGAVTNLVLALAKFVGGVLGGSTALVADAFHSLSDLLTDGVVLFTHRIGQKPRDEDHPYGHGRAETIGATLVGSIIIFTGFGLGYDVWQTIESGTERVPEWIALAAAAFSIVTNEGLFRYTKAVGEKISSPSIIANAWHHRSDAISSIAALAGIFGAMRGHPIMDPLAGGVVAVMIVKVGYDIASGGLRDLMDTGLSEENTRKIQEMVNNIPGVIAYHDLRTRRIGGEILMDVHILVDNDLTVSEGHKIADTVRRNLMVAFANVQDVLVHVDSEVDDIIEPLYPVTREELKTLIEPVIAETEGVLNQSKFLVHYLKGKTNIDLFVRVDKTKTVQESETILHNLKKRLKGENRVDDVNIYLDVNQD